MSADSEPTKAQAQWAFGGILRRIASGTVPPRSGLRELVATHRALPERAAERFVGAEYGVAEFVGYYYGYDDLEERPHEVSFEGHFGVAAAAALDAEVIRLARAWLEERGA